MENEEMQSPEVNADAVEQNENNSVMEMSDVPEKKVRPQVEVTEEMIEKSSKTLSTMLDFLGLDGVVKAEKRPSKINLIVSSEDAGRIIGRKGQSLESLQLLLNRMMQNGSEDFPKIYIDIDGYSSNNTKGGNGGGERRFPRGGGERRGGEPRERRGGRRSEDGDKDEILQQQAIDAAKEVRRWGESVTLPAMNSHDRRIIHISLENETDIQTESVGEGNMKSVVVSLKK